MEPLPIITKDEEIRDLKRMLKLAEVQLAKAMNALADYHRQARGEWHHRAFEKKCGGPMVEEADLTLGNHNRQQQQVG